jgi:uncharacterized repeat protein (TIGR03803 family)
MMLRALVALFALVLGTGTGAWANAEKTILSLNQADGAEMAGGVISDSAGNLYGMAAYGGIDNIGTIYELPAHGPVQVLYNFTYGLRHQLQLYTPVGELLLGANGTLYGAAALGGDKDCGGIFALVPGKSITAVHDFNQKDGCNPFAGVIADASGNLYGTTSEGYSHHRAFGGTVFKLGPGGTETVLDIFKLTGINSPAARLAIDANGNLVGTATSGGAGDAGGVFEVSPTGRTKTLYTFTGGADGGVPVAPVTIGPNGDLYGTTSQGGDANCQCGTIFQIAPDGTETTLHTFTFADGAYPEGGLLLDGSGNLYGTTSYGGSANNRGTVFELAPNGTLTTLTAFPGSGKNNDQPNGPIGNLISDGGSLYGATVFGGRFSNGVGTVFQVTQ